MTLLFMSMAMVAGIAAPGMVRIDARRDLGVFSQLLRVVHLGQSAIVLLGAGESSSGLELLTITDARGGATPGGLCVADAVDYARVRGEIAHAGRGGIVDLSGWVSHGTFVPVDLTLSRSELHGRTIAAVADALSVDSLLASSLTFDGGLARIRSRAADLASAALALDPERVLPGLIGAGPGTTPTGDDMVVGCFAALAVLGRSDAVCRLADATTPLLQATTTTSRHYLVAAASGRFAEHVHELVAGFATAGPAERILEHARHWGATSGVDLVIGLTATLRADLTARAEETAA